MTEAELLRLSQLLLDPEQRTTAPRPGQIGTVRMMVAPNSIDESQRTMRFVCSTKSIDRYGEIVEPSAFRDFLPTFEANPVFIAGHVYTGESGEPTTIGSWRDLKITADGLEGTAWFMEGDALAEKYWQRYKSGVQRAVSVGWITYAHEMREMEIDGARKRVRVFTRVELIEISAVAIPANRMALVRAAGQRAAAASNPTPGSDLDAIRAVVRDTIRTEMTDPVGPVASLIREVVEAVHGCGISGHSHHHPSEPSAPDGLDVDEAAQFKRALDDLVG